MKIASLFLKTLRQGLRSLVRTKKMSFCQTVMKTLRRRLMSTKRTQSQDRSIYPWSNAIRWILWKIESDARLISKISIMVIKPSRYIRQKELKWWSLYNPRVTKTWSRRALARLINWRLLSCLRMMRISCNRWKLTRKSLTFWVSTSVLLLSKWRRHVRVIPRRSRNNSKSWWRVEASSVMTWGRWKTFWKYWTSPVRNGKIRMWPSWCLFWRSYSSSKSEGPWTRPNCRRSPTTASMYSTSQAK